MGVKFVTFFLIFTIIQIDANVDEDAKRLVENLKKEYPEIEMTKDDARGMVENMYYFLNNDGKTSQDEKEDIGYKPLAKKVPLLEKEVQELQNTLTDLFANYTIKPNKFDKKKKTPSSNNPGL